MEVNFTDLHEIGFVLEKENIVLDYDSSKIENIQLDLISSVDGIYKYSLTLNSISDGEFNLKANLDFENYASYKSEITLNKIVDLNDLEVKLSNLKEYIKLNELNEFQVQVLPADFSGYTVNAYFEGGKIALLKNGGTYNYLGNIVCSDNLVVEISYENEIISKITKQVQVLNPPITLAFEINPKDYGIEELPTIGNLKIENGEYVKNTTKFGFVTDVDLSYIEFKSLDEFN